jgi:hypothetical protein
MIVLYSALVVASAAILILSELKITHRPLRAVIAIGLFSFSCFLCFGIGTKFGLNIGDATARNQIIDRVCDVFDILKLKSEGNDPKEIRQTILLLSERFPKSLVTDKKSAAFLNHFNTNTAEQGAAANP